MRTLLVAAAILLAASSAFAAPTLGVYFAPSHDVMDYSPPPESFFDVYLFVYTSDFGFIYSLYYQLQTPLDPGHFHFVIAGVTYPSYVSAATGDPFSGQGIGFWPPLNGSSPAWYLICTYEAMQEDPLEDYPLVVGPYPGNGQPVLVEFPSMAAYDITGLTSILNPSLVGTPPTSWGAIKSLYR